MGKKPYRCAGAFHVDDTSLALKECVTMSNSIGSRAIVAWMVFLSAAGVAIATPEFVEHFPSSSVYGEPAGTTMRSPEAPQPGQSIDIWARIGFSFYYTNVAVYYTTDGSAPQGAFGTPSGTTSVAADGNWVRNDAPPNNTVDWWRTTLPAGVQTSGVTVRYKVGAWHSGGGIEAFANNTGCADGTCDDPAGTPALFTYTVGGTAALPWPGAGAGSATPQEGYPDVAFWKEEGVVGNNYINVMLDQNGTVYDVYYPSAGCVFGMGTKNEGYVDGLDTFPPGLPPGYRGQMNLNQAMGGIRVDGMTYWLSNPDGAGYSNVSQQYVPDTNVIETSATLTAAGHNILVQQYDFCPKGIAFPTDDGDSPNRGIYVKRYLLTNNGAEPKTAAFYYYADYALNGGDSYDSMFADAARGTMVAYDNTQRWTSASGEYNPTTTGDYDKNVSIYLATAMKRLDTVGGAAGTPATDFWSDTSSDTDRGWIGIEVELPVGVTKEINVAFVGGFDTFAGATGTYDYQMDNAIDWFLAGNMSAAQAATESHWTDWLAQGVVVDTPDDAYNETFKRGLLATALHLDGRNGGIIAGMHNGAYPFVWPRDGVWAAVTLDRTGHTAEAAEIYRYLRDIAYRAEEEPGRKGWWYQKYTTDGYIVWNAPQVDETSVFPWGAYYHYNVTGDVQFLADHYVTVYEAARASSEDSTVDSRLYYNDTYQLMYSNNLWEDAWGEFLYSNASVERGLRDAAAIADVMDQNVCPGGPGACNYHNDKALFLARADAIHSGQIGRLLWDGENTDISHLGLVYPFNVFAADDPLVAHLVDRMNGVATDTFGNNHPIMNFASHGEWEGLVNRYWADTYWHNFSGPNPDGSPWFLTTLWYGCYYAQRQNLNPGKGDIDNHKYRFDLLLDRLGPIGLGAEQIAPSNSLLYPGQMDFLLQAAWPNAWESMSFLVDAVMMFLDYTPDAPGNTLRIRPKLPSAWSTMTFENLTLGSHRIDVTCAEDNASAEHTFTNRTGAAVAYDTVLRIPAGSTLLGVLENSVGKAYDHDPAIGAVSVAGDLATGAGAATNVGVYLYAGFADCMTGPDAGPPAAGCEVYDIENDGDVDLADFAEWGRALHPLP